MTPEQILAWAKQFEAEHNYLPNADPALKAKGYSEQEMLKEHLDALKFGQEFQAMNGRPPSEYDYRNHWFRGWTPEAIESGGAPDYIADAPRPAAVPQVQPYNGGFSTSGFSNYGRTTRRVPSYAMMQGGY